MCRKTKLKNMLLDRNGKLKETKLAGFPLEINLSQIFDKMPPQNHSHIAQCEPTLIPV